jgi:hypothetical protein
MNLLNALIESGMLREDSPGVMSWQPSMKRAEVLAALLSDFEYKPFVGLDAKDLQGIPHDHYAGAIWADQKLREKNE